MEIEPQVCFRALVARDRRFDGLFFVGVTTTGIYCRPICPARTPRHDRCRFFTNSAAAEYAGFRPCLRCRPELAPGHAPVDATHRVAHAAAALIQAGALNDGGSIEALAKGLGLSSRQLRRVVQQQLGVSPIELAQTQRLLLAKQLLTETSLPLIQVAYSSGFASVRRFNALFRSRYRLTPGQLRQQPRSTHGADFLRLTLAYRPPFDWQAIIAFLTGRATPGVEMVENNAYLRTVSIGKQRGWLRVKALAKRDALTVDVAMSLIPVLPRVLSRVRHLFDVNARPDVIVAHLGDDRWVGQTVRRHPGLRVPGAFDGFELAVRAILGQQVSVQAATTLAGRLAHAYGQPIATPFAALNRLSPAAHTLANIAPGALKKLGIMAPRAESICALARAVSDGPLSLEQSDMRPEPEQTIKRLIELPGIGAWTAHYIALRALRWPDAFPDGDLGLRQGLDGMSAARLRTVANAWRPWRAYAAMHIWNSLHLRKGAIRA